MTVALAVWCRRHRRRLDIIPFADLRELQLLGEGGFGQVHSAVWRNTKVAVKRNGVKCTETDAIAMERRLLESIPPHANVVRVYGICIDAPDGNVRIVMELAMCSLESFLQRPPAGVVRHSRCCCLHSAPRSSVTVVAV
jgi:serine/threonine protein kinase